MPGIPSMGRQHEFFRVYEQESSTHPSASRCFLAAFFPKILAPAFKAGAPPSDDSIHGVVATPKPGGQRQWR